MVLRILAMALVLSSLDVAAVVCFKEASLQKNPLLAVAGLGCLMAVGALLIITLDWASLTLVSLGWIVTFQIVVMGVDRWLYDVRQTPLQISAVLVALLCLGVAALAPTPKAGGRHAAGQPVMSGALPPVPRQGGWYELKEKPAPGGELEQKLRERIRARG